MSPWVQEVDDATRTLARVARTLSPGAWVRVGLLALLAGELVFLAVVRVWAWWA